MGEIHELFVSALSLVWFAGATPDCPRDEPQEDVNGEKLTAKKWWIFGADFFTVWCRFFHGLQGT